MDGERVLRKDERGLRGCLALGTESGHPERVSLLELAQLLCYQSTAHD